MGIPNLGASMNYNDIFFNLNTMHIQGAQSHIEIYHTNLHETRQCRSTIFEPLAVPEVHNEQEIPNTINNDKNYGYKNSKTS